MEVNEFKSRCESLIERLENIIETKVTYMGYEGSDDVLREFRHLVYAFDSKLPLNEELSNPNALRLCTPYESPDGSKTDRERVIGYMRFFIKYIEDYCE